MSRFAWLLRLADVRTHRDFCGSRRPHRGAARRRRIGLLLTQLEGRTLPSCFTALTVSDLINDINAANKHGGSNTITLGAPTTSPYVLIAVDNSTDGPTGLPVISKKDALTIVGKGDSIERSTASGTPTFRLFDVAGGGSLTLNNLTLQNGAEVGSGVSAEGGAIYSQGTVDLNNAIVRQNTAQGNVGKSGTRKDHNGSPGQDAAGGGIWSSGSLTIENGSLVDGNEAIGGLGGTGLGGMFSSSAGVGGPGGAGTGGGLYVAGGSVTISGSTFSSNTAQGGTGGISFVQSVGGNGAGGALAVAAGTVNLTGTTLNNNTAQGGTEQFLGNNFVPGGLPGTGSGGALYASGGSAELSSDTLEFNLASGGSGPALGSPPAARSNSGYGGALYAASGATMTLCGDTLESNTASASDGFNNGYGGGIFIASGATVYIDSSTLANTINNTDSSGLNGSTANIDGTYILQTC
jgi:hypothetical protein